MLAQDKTKKNIKFGFGSPKKLNFCDIHYFQVCGLEVKLFGQEFRPIFFRHFFLNGIGFGIFKILFLVILHLDFKNQIPSYFAEFCNTFVYHLSQYLYIFWNATHVLPNYHRGSHHQIFVATVHYTLCAFSYTYRYRQIPSLVVQQNDSTTYGSLNSLENHRYRYRCQIK